MSTFRITLLSFEAEPEEEREFKEFIERAFEIAPENFDKLIASLPAVISDNLSVELAETHTKKLQSLGAQVVLEEIGNENPVGTEKDDSSKSEDPLDFEFNFEDDFSFVEDKKEASLETNQEKAVDDSFNEEKKVEEELSLKLEEKENEATQEESLEPTIGDTSTTDDFNFSLDEEETKAEITEPEADKSETDTQNDQEDSFDFDFVEDNTAVKESTEEEVKNSEESDFSFDDSPAGVASDAGEEKPEEVNFDFSLDENTNKTDEESINVKLEQKEDKGTDKIPDEEAPSDESSTEKTTEAESTETSQEETTEEAGDPKEEVLETKKKGAKKVKKKLSAVEKKQLGILAGLAALVIGTFVLTDPMGLFKEEQATATSNINKNMVDQLLEAQKNIIAPLPETPTPSPTIPPIEEKYFASTFENDISTTETSILVLGTEVKEISISITTPKPRKRTFEEIALDKPEPVWLEKAVISLKRDITEENAREDKEISFKFSADARTFLSDSVGNERIYPDATIVGSYSKKDDKIMGVWELKHGPITNRISDQNFVERLSKKEFALYYKGSFEVGVAKKPEKYELNFERLQKIGVIAPEEEDAEEDSTEE